MNDNVKYDLDSILNLLPSSVRDNSSTGWKNMYQIDGNELSNIQALIEQINNWRSVDNAKGITLDYLGNDLGIARNGADDDFYRFKIHSKKIERNTDGTCNSLYRLVASTLDINPSDIFVHTNDLPNQVVIDNIPTDKLTTNQKVEWLIEQLQNTVIYGIKIATVNFDLNTNADIKYGGTVGLEKHFTI